MANPYSVTDFVNMITGLKNSGQNEQAYKMFNGLNAAGQRGALGSALSQAWGADVANNWINKGNDQWHGVGFDTATGNMTSDGSMKLADWDPTRFDRNAGTNFMREWNAAGGDVNDPAIYNNPAALAEATAKQDAWIQNWAKSVGGTGYSPSGALKAENDAIRATHGMDANNNVIGVGMNNGQPMPGAVPSGGATSPGGFAKPIQVGGTNPTTGLPTPGVPLSSLANPSGQFGTSGASGATLPTADAAQWNPQTYARPENTKTPWDFFNDAGYQFQLGEGTKGIENSAAARGGLMSGATLKALTDYKTGLANQHYGEAFDRYNQDRNFNEGQYQSDRAFGQNQSMDARDYNNANRMWDTQFNENQRRDTRDFDYGSYINDRNYNRGVYTDDRDYSTGVDRYNIENDWRNRQFDYATQSGDRAFDANILQSLMQAGLGASGTDANLASTLAAILSGNTLTGANAGAAGTIGQSNNVQQILQQLLTSLYSRP